jgi:hypothetical protein
MIINKSNPSPSIKLAQNERLIYICDFSEFETRCLKMPRTLEEMVSKGYTKATAKAPRISASWEAAKGRMKDGYGKMPFGPTRKANYNAAVDVAKHYQDWDKWRTNYAAKMRE